MKILPAIVTPPRIDRLVAGRLHKLRFPAIGALRAVEPGDLLWVREPFYLKHRHDKQSPSVARRAGAIATFPAGLHAGGLGGAIGAMNLGRLRAATDLPKGLHRQHLLVAGVSFQQLHDITDDEIRTEGFRDRPSWAVGWDALNAFGHRTDQRWENNPEVIVITFERHNRPVAAAAKPVLSDVEGPDDADG